MSFIPTDQSVVFPKYGNIIINWSSSSSSSSSSPPPSYLHHHQLIIIIVVVVVVATPIVPTSSSIDHHHRRRRRHRTYIIHHYHLHPFLFPPPIFPFFLSIFPVRHAAHSLGMFSFWLIAYFRAPKADVHHRELHFPSTFWQNPPPVTLTDRKRNCCQRPLIAHSSPSVIVQAESGWQGSKVNTSNARFSFPCMVRFQLQYGKEFTFLTPVYGIWRHIILGVTTENSGGSVWAHSKSTHIWYDMLLREISKRGLYIQAAFSLPSGTNWTRQ